MPRNYIPDLRFVPERLEKIDARTPLCDGVTIGSFLNGVTLDHITEIEDRKQLARNLIPHAEIVRAIRDNDKRFALHQLVVVEGIYKAALQEQITENEENHNFLATTGRGIVYELRRNGKTDNDKTFELAKYLQVYHPTFDRLVLDYDTYVEGELNAQIVIQMPVIPADYNVKFKRIAETRFNNTTQATSQLVEITEIPDTTVKFPAELPDQVAGYFTVGDLHARLLRVFGGDPWQSYASDGRTSRDTAIKENIKKIKSGEVVVISAGYNDTVTSTDAPAIIAERVKSIVNESIRRSHVITFLLFPVTAKASETRHIQVRQAIVSALSSFNDVRIVDLNDSQYALGFDGQSLTKESYISISNILI